MNQVNLIGNLTKDPEVRYTTGENQTAMARFSIAVNDGYGEKQKTYFIPIVVFGRQAENCEKFLTKGKKVAVSGKLQTGSYEKNGQKVFTTDVVAYNVEFIGGNGASANAEPQTEIDGFARLDEEVPF